MTLDASIQTVRALACGTSCQSRAQVPSQRRSSAELAEVLMTLLHRLLCLICLATLVTRLGRTQTLSRTETSTANSSPGGWLGREEPKAVAWRAYDAMLAHDRSAIPELIALASQWQPVSPQTYADGSQWPRLSSQQKEERDALTVVLDALIQLKAPVHSTALRNLAAEYTSPAAAPSMSR